MPKRALMCIIVGLFLGSSSVAFAKISKKAKEEISSYAEKNATVVDEEGKVAWLMTKAFLVSRKEAAMFDAYKTDENEAVRLGAGLALLIAGDKKATAFIGKELGASMQRLELLRLYVSALDNKKEIKLLTALIKKAKPEVAQDYIRYWAETPEHFKAFKALLKNKKTSALAWTGFGALSPAATLTIAKANLKNKNIGVRKQILMRLIVMADWPQYFSKTKDLLEHFSKNESDDELKLVATKALVAKHDRAAQNRLLKIAEAAKLEKRIPLFKFLLDNHAKVKVSKAALESKNNEERRLSYILSATGNKKLAKKLLEMYTGTEFQDRLIAVQSVGRTGGSEAAVILSQALFEGNVEIRKSAAKSLAELADAKTIPVLKQALVNEKNREVKLLVIDAIGATKSEEGLQILRFQVTSRDRKVKEHTVSAIRLARKSSGAKALGSLIRDRDRKIQWAAFLGLMELDAAKGKTHFKMIFRNPILGYFDDIDKMAAPQRKMVYHWIFEQGPPSVKQDATARAMKYHQFGPQIGLLLSDSALSTELRKALVFHLLNSNIKNAKLYVETFARKSTSPTLTRAAVWGLVRNAKKSDEATFRGLLNAKDKAAAAVAMFGFTTLQ